MLPTAMAMTCIRRNLSGWSAVMNQTRQAIGHRTACISRCQSQKNRTCWHSTQLADLLFGHHALDLLRLALDPVTSAPVRLDREARGNRIDVALRRDIATLRSLRS